MVNKEIQIWWKLDENWKKNIQSTSTTSLDPKEKWDGRCCQWKTCTWLRYIYIFDIRLCNDRIERKDSCEHYLKEESMALLMNQSDLPVSRRMYGHNFKNRSEIEESGIWFILDLSLNNLVKWEQKKERNFPKILIL